MLTAKSKSLAVFYTLWIEGKTLSYFFVKKKKKKHNCHGNIVPACHLCDCCFNTLFPRILPVMNACMKEDMLVTVQSNHHILPIGKVPGPHLKISNLCAPNFVKTVHDKFLVVWGLCTSWWYQCWSKCDPIRSGHSKRMLMSLLFVNWQCPLVVGSSRTDVNTKGEQALNLLWPHNDPILSRVKRETALLICMCRV